MYAYIYILFIYTSYVNFPDKGRLQQLLRRYDHGVALLDRLDLGGRRCVNYIC